ncbi:uncharacterized protein LOC143026758 [Oratosquilla oratoria]|uniref:uncharacterized protein LOC143026758 n=1 Tax=Oratosquilla oratoria TaxID=337810 RepID=UPI003F764C3B
MAWWEVHFTSPVAAVAPIASADPQIAATTSGATIAIVPIVRDVVLGYNASLPCDIRSPSHDSPTLTLWYIGSEETPVYSYDERPGSRGSQWSEPAVFGSRAVYLPQEHPPVLFLTQVSTQDSKLYRCRVDFADSNSQVAWVKLNVIAVLGRRPAGEPHMWSEPAVFGSRAVYLPQEHPPVLFLTQVSTQDSKLYRCRVDFADSNSQVAWVKLNVIDNPGTCFAVLADI